MKILFLAVSAVILFASCNSTSDGTSKERNSERADSSSEVNATGSPANGKSSPATALLAAYLRIKNGLVNDNGADAATGGNEFVQAIAKVDQSSFTADQKKLFIDVADDAKEMAEHIGKNGNKIDHQREHFDMLSTDMFDIVKSFGAGQSLYQDYCPMFNNNKGATWLSETKAIRNPYMGTKQPACGSIKEEIK